MISKIGLENRQRIRFSNDQQATATGRRQRGKQQQKMLFIVTIAVYCKTVLCCFRWTPNVNLVISSKSRLNRSGKLDPAIVKTVVKGCSPSN